MLEEVLVNVISCAYRDDARHDIGLTVTVGSREVLIRIGDDGVAFDPLQAQEPRVPASIDEATPGGLGILLVRRFCSTATYQRSGGRNRLTLRIARSD